MTVNMPTPAETRKRHFRAALALAGMTSEQLAEKLGVSNGHLCAVARGDRESPPMEAEIEKFIKKHLISTPALAS